MDKEFGDRLMRFYRQPKPTPFARSIDKISNRLRLIRDRRAIARNYDVIHGHFFAHIMNCIPGPKQYCIFLRDPVARTTSHYLYWQARYSELNGQASPKLLREMMHKQMSLNQFAELPQIANFYSRFLGRVELERFAFVGLTEEYQRSIKLFDKIFGLRLEVTHRNATNREIFPRLLEDVDLQRLQSSQKANRTIYDRAVARFEKLCSQYL